MDLNKFDTQALSDKGLFLHLEFDGRPLNDDDGKPIGLRLRGRDSKTMREHRHKQENRRIARIRVGNGGQLRGVTSENTEAEQLETLVEATLELVRVKVDGKPVETTRDNVAELLERFPWIQRQAWGFYNSDESMLGESSAS